MMILVPNSVYKELMSQWPTSLSHPIFTKTGQLSVRGLTRRGLPSPPQALSLECG